MITPDICIYHAHCPDGFTAAWVVWKKFQNTNHHVEFVAANHQDTDVDWVEMVRGKRAVICDFSFKRPLLQQMHASAKRLLVLDHHKTAQANLAGLDYCIFDMNRSGAGITWDYFNPKLAQPRLVQYIQDQDIWTWKLPYSKEVCAYLGSIKRTFDNWQLYYKRLENDDELQFICERGYSILQYKEQLVQQAVNRAETWTVLGFEQIPCINLGVLPGEIFSEAMNRMSQGAAFAAGYSFQDGYGRVSLRSAQTGQDVSELAKKFAVGGGHEHAAAFSISPDCIQISQKSILFPAHD